MYFNLRMRKPNSGTDTNNTTNWDNRFEPEGWVNYQFPQHRADAIAALVYDAMVEYGFTTTQALEFIDLAIERSTCKIADDADQVTMKFVDGKQAQIRMVKKHVEHDQSRGITCSSMLED